MKENLKNSCILTITAVLTSALAFGVLDRDLFADVDPDPGVQAWFSKCVWDTNCPVVNCNQPDNQECAVCAQALTRKKCEAWNWSTCNKNTPPPDDNPNCGDRWTGFCLTGQCFYDPVQDLDGTCKRSWCS